MEESAGARSLWNLWGRICHCLFLGSGGWLPAVLGTWLADTLLRSLPLSSQAFLLPVCLCPDFLPFIKMPVTGLCACVLCVCSVAQSCLTLCSPMDCSSPVSSIHGILKARRLVGCHALLQEIFLTQRSNPHFLHFLHCRWTRYH